MSKSEKAPGGVTPEQSGKKLPGFVKKVGALALALLAAGGIWHKAHEPAMNDEQMDKATEIAAEAVLDKMGEFEGEDPSYVDKDGDYSGYRNDEGNHMSVFAYDISSEYRDPITGETKYPGTYVAITVENDGNRGKRNEKGTLSKTKFTFKSDNPQDFNNLVADGKLTMDEAKEFINSDGVSISEIESLEDTNGDDALTAETLEHNVYDGGDDNWGLKVNNKDGASGYEDSDEIGNVFTGDSAVAEVQKVVDYVESNWDKSK